MAKVWNITDHPKTKDAPRVLMVMGKSVKPGHSVRVDDSSVERAHKLKKLVDAGLVHIGNTPPKDYSRNKTPPKAVLPAKATRAHGGKAKPQPPKAPEKKPEPKKPEPKDQKVEKPEEKKPEEKKAEPLKGLKNRAR